MIKRAIKSVSVIIFWIVTIWFVFTLTKWWSYRNYRLPQHGTVFVGDTLHITQYKDRLSIIEKIKWKTAKPETVWVAHYEPWMDSVHCALSLERKGDRVKVVMKKNKDVFSYTYRCNANRWKWYGTEQGGKLIQQRWKNPLHWKGIMIGGEYGLSNRTVVPYIETGISVWKLEFIAGINKEKIYGKIGGRLW